MASISASRRSFLLRAAGLGTLAILPGLRGTSAAAFTLQDMPANSRAGLAYAARCGEDGMHQKIMTNLESELADIAMPASGLISRQAVCPLCGCPIIATKTRD